MTHTLTDEDGRIAQYTLTPNFGGMTMTVKTEEPKAFDAVIKALDRWKSNPESHLADIELMRAVKAITGRVCFLSDAHAFAQGVEAAYEAGKREAVPEGVVNEVKFLIDRLEDFENEHVGDDDAGRDWFGHITPSISRVRAMLSASPKAGE